MPSLTPGDNLPHGYDQKIFVAGHTGLLGSALMRRLPVHGYANVVTRDHQTLDLTDRAGVADYLSDERPDTVILTAARVGGILANSSFPAEFIETNLSIQTSVIEGARKAGVQRLIFFGSNCAYPAETAELIREEQLFTGPLESSSAAYAVAKIAGMQMCAAYNAQYGTSYMSIIPATLYGPGDNMDPATSHVLGALLQKYQDAVTGGDAPVIWGTGEPRREFLFADDLADACATLIGLDTEAIDRLCGATGYIVNAGSGQDVSIKELAGLIGDVVGYDGPSSFDRSRPDGMKRRLLDSSRLSTLGWRPAVTLEDGIRRTHEWLLKSREMATDGLR